MKKCMRAMKFCISWFLCENLSMYSGLSQNTYIQIYYLRFMAWNKYTHLMRVCRVCMRCILCKSLPISRKPTIFLPLKSSLNYYLKFSILNFYIEKTKIFENAFRRESFSESPVKSCVLTNEHKNRYDKLYLECEHLFIYEKLYKCEEIFQTAFEHKNDFNFVWKALNVLDSSLYTSIYVSPSPFHIERVINNI